MLLDISTQLTRIFLISFIILGTIGNLLNLLVFTRPTLLRSSCTLYFIAASIDNILAIYIAVLYRLLLDGFSIDIGSLSTIVCKLRGYFGYIFLSLSPYFFILACFDRYCSSSALAKYRSWRNKTTAKRCIIGAIILSSILYVHIAIFFEIRPVDSSVTCYPQQGIYNLFWRIFYLIIYCFSPCICMGLLFLLTLINIRRQSRQIRPNLTRINHLYRHLDRNLIQMLFSQVLTQLICILPFAIINLLEIFIDSNTILFIFFKKIFTIPLFAIYATSFYVYTMSSRFYRQEFMKLLPSCK